MRKVLVALAMTGFVAWAAPAAPAHGDHDVEIRDDSFAPDRLEVRIGDIVEWRNEGERPHSVLADDGSFASRTLQPGDEFEIRFDTPGTYAYRSGAEGDEGMGGVVVVLPEGEGSDGSGSGSGTASGEETGTDNGGGRGGGSAGDRRSSGGEPTVRTGARATSRPSSGDVVLAQAAAVSIQDDRFVPARVEIDPGGSVVWQHDGGNPHTVTADDGSFDSGTMSTGQTFSRSLDQPGTYSYYCRFHGGPGGQGMSGVVLVRGEVTEEPPADAGEEVVEAGGGLAATGISVLLPLGVAVALLGAGLATLILSVRRRSQPR